MIVRASAFLLVGLSLFAQDGPQPPVVKPGLSGHAPSDAVVLFDGGDPSEWEQAGGGNAKWTAEEGALVCKSGTGDLVTRRKFKSAQIHIEFWIPYMPEAHGQSRGNSGVFLQGLYEIQVLDSYQNPTYANGSCGALYGQHAPLVNACLPPERWQTYDIVFHAAKCEGGKVVQPGTVTVLQNGILVQDAEPIKGPTADPNATGFCEPGPLRLQDHNSKGVKATPLRYRNIWYRPLEDPAANR